MSMTNHRKTNARFAPRAIGMSSPACASRGYSAGLSQEEKHTAHSISMVQVFAPARRVTISFFTTVLEDDASAYSHLAPVTQQEESEEHSAQMGAMGHSVASLGEGRGEFDDGISHHKILRTYGHGQREYEHTLVGQQITEGKKYAVDGSRCTHYAHIIDDARQHRLYELCHFLCESGSESAGEIVDDEVSLTQHLLQDVAEHPECEHVEEKVLPTAVHEHVGERLPEVERGCEEEVQTQKSVQVDIVHSPNHHRCKT